MQTQMLVPTEDHRVGARDVADTMRRVLEEDGVKRVSVRDTRAHTLFEVPVRPDETGLVMEPLVAAVTAVSEAVGDVVLRVEKEGELPAEGASRASARERERAAGKRQATGAEMQNGVVPEEVAQSPANVTEADVERIREANAVPEGSEEAVRRIPPEHEGEPDLEGTGVPPAERQPRGKKPAR